MRIQNKFGCGFRQKKDLSYFGSEPNSFLEKLDSGSTTLYCIIVDVCKSLGYPKVVVWSMVYVPSQLFKYVEFIVDKEKYKKITRSTLTKSAENRRKFYQHPRSKI